MEAQAACRQGESGDEGMLKLHLSFDVEFKVNVVMIIFQRPLQVPVENSAPATPVAKKNRLAPSGFYNILRKYTAENNFIYCYAHVSRCHDSSTGARDASA